MNDAHRRAVRYAIEMHMKAHGFDSDKHKAILIPNWLYDIGRTVLNEQNNSLLYAGEILKAGDGRMYFRETLLLKKSEVCG